VAEKNKFLKVSFLAVLVSCAVSCTGMPFFVPNPPGGGTSKSDTAVAPAAPELTKAVPVPAPADGADTIDFAVAFRADTGGTVIVPPSLPKQAREKTPVVSGPVSELSMPGRMIRIALRRNVSKAELQTSEAVEVHSPSLSAPARCTGSLIVEKKVAGYLTITVNNGPPHEVALPCSLIAVNQSNLFTLGGERYRGSIIVTGKEVYSLINLISVENYLRGVLPIEMGKRGMEEIEALKAQAVAARTYAYRRVACNKGQPYDVLSTTADQVYGGADVESAECNYAINATGDLVLWWRDSLAEIYYHSTCGGRTANVSDVWGLSSRVYLCSKSDIAPDGQAYCSFAPAFSWEESWDAAELSKIVRTTARQTLPDAHFGGNLQSLKIEQRFGCGRVKLCRITGSEGSFECGGDKLRSVLRRKSAGGDILRSANFTVEKNGPRIFSVHGSGFGHGVGMCQMGAIGRARHGQDFEQILKAYFSPAQIVRIQHTSPAQ
jgi:stage II sporulation protein D